MSSASLCTTQIAARRRAQTCRSRSNSFGCARKRPAERKVTHRIIGIDALQHPARLLGIHSHLLGQRLRRGEGLIRTEEGNEFRLDLLGIEVAGKIEEMTLSLAPTGETTSTPKPSVRPSAASSSVVPVRPLP